MNPSSWGLAGGFVAIGFTFYAVNHGATARQIGSTLFLGVAMILFSMLMRIPERTYQEHDGWRATLSFLFLFAAVPVGLAVIFLFFLIGMGVDVCAISLPLLC